MAHWPFHRELDEAMLPLAYPRLSDYISPPESATPEKLHAEMDVFEAEAARVKEENDLRFERAMPWIKQCAMLHGLSHSFDLSGRIYPMRHRSWCPAPYWQLGDERKLEWPRG